MRNIIIFFVVILTSILLITPAYAAGPWKGKIIDIETKEPLEGAVVLAVWMRAYRTPAGDNTYFYNSREVLTDKEGRFEISAYTTINLLPVISYIREPEFTIFKPGYRSLSGRHLEENVINNPAEFDRDGIMYRLSPGVIELPKLKTREERRRGQPSPVGDKKDWKKQRELIKLLRQEWRYLYNEAPKDLYKIEE